MYTCAMTIYIESFLLQNVLINFCLLRLVFVSLKSKTNLFRLICASIIGAGFSVISAIFLSNQIILNILKFCCAIVVLLIAFKQTKKQFIISLILLFLYTYALGGAMMNLTSTNYYTSFGVVSTSKFSFELITIIAIAITYLYELIAKHISIKLKTNNLIYPITLYAKNKKINLQAYLDTGNLLNYNGAPVIIIDIQSYLKLFDKNLIDYYLSKDDEIIANTVNGSDNLKLFKIDKIEIRVNKERKTFLNHYIAVSPNKFKNSNYQALLSPLNL